MRRVGDPGVDGVEPGSSSGSDRAQPGLGAINPMVYGGIPATMLTSLATYWADLDEEEPLDENYGSWA